MTIMQMTSAHVPQVARLEQTCFQDPWSERSIASELENPLSLWLVAMEEDRLLGYVGSQTVLDETDMMNVAVDPASRRQGVARGLIQELIDQLKQRGSRKLSLEVRASNLGAIRLYESLGFVRLGCRPGYYRNPREDAWILGKEWQV